MFKSDVIVFKSDIIEFKSDITWCLRVTSWCSQCYTLFYLFLRHKDVMLKGIFYWAVKIPQKSNKRNESNPEGQQVDVSPNKE